MLLILGAVIVFTGIAALGYKYWQSQFGERSSLQRVKLDSQHLYDDCNGNPFIGTCQIDGKCIDSLFEQRVFDLWKKDLLKRQNISEQVFNDHVEVSDVQLTTTEQRLNVRIQAIYISDWIRSRNADTVTVNTTLPVEDITDEQIQQAIDSIHSSGDERKGILHLEPIIAVTQVQEIIDAGYSGYIVQPMFCTIHQNDAGVSLPLWVTIDESKNKCVDGSLNLLTGESTYHDFLCTVD